MSTAIPCGEVIKYVIVSAISSDINIDRMCPIYMNASYDQSEGFQGDEDLDLAHHRVNQSTTIQEKYITVFRRTTYKTYCILDNFWFIMSMSKSLNHITGRYEIGIAFEPFVDYTLPKCG